MNKKEQEEVEKVAKKYFRNMQLEMQRYANEISRLIFENFVKEINRLQKQLVKDSASYEVLEQLKSKYAGKQKNE